MEEVKYPFILQNGFMYNFKPNFQLERKYMEHEIRIFSMHT